MAFKPVNRFTSNEFHDWQRENLPGYLIIQDVDHWFMVVSNSQDQYEPKMLVELKRSSYEPERWAPWEADKPNYVAMWKLAEHAELPFTIIYFKKGQPLEKVAWFAVSDVDADSREWISYDKEILDLGTLKARILRITGNR